MEWLQAWYSNRNVQYATVAILFAGWIYMLWRAYSEAKQAWEISGTDGGARWEKVAISSRALYLFIQKPSWAGFRCWYAALSNDPWIDIAATFILGFLPLPGLPSSFGGRVSTILTKIGIYKITLALLLGSPNYAVPCPLTAPIVNGEVPAENIVLRDASK